MQWQELLFTQGFGTRRICAGLIQQGLVRAGGQTLTDATADVEPTEGMAYQVAGVDWAYHAPAYLMLHKPAGYECSQRPGAWPSIYTLLPGPLRQRPGRNATPGVQAIGRLDQDTTGLLLLSDDGAFIHRMSSPKKLVPKLYQVTTADPVTPQQVQRLLAGVVLDDSPRPVRAAACEATGTHTLDLTLTEGKYHQVKRMLAAVGNRVTALHRARIGALALPADLAPGQWRWLTAEDLQALSAAAPAQEPLRA
ncbi:16S rRNA pseudouridine(516) synthase [Ramlibacter sp.]|uniref:16S rRNA pseudouridine(516) synthase n=1 Tax=Ramlibacter sp. TaxID=1917967 RepID=UPI0035B4E90A